MFIATQILRSESAISITKISTKKFSHHQNSIKFFQTQLRHVVLLEKCVERCEKASIFNALRHLGATPKPWVAGSSPPAPAKKIKSTFFVGFFFLLGYKSRRTRRGAVVNDSPVDCQSRGRPKSRSKAEIKNSALRRSDETESSRPFPIQSIV